MKPPALRYRHPVALSEALQQLSEPEAKVLAGGQSLIPLLNLRLVHPSSLVDINGLGELRGLAATNDELRIGALVRHLELEESPQVRAALPLLSEIACGVAYRAIRTRGTFCGSLAHADPAAEWPLVLAALDGRVRCRSARGEREIPASQLFEGYFATALEPDELIVEASLPLWPGWTWGFAKFARKAGEFSLGLALAGVQRADDGRIAAARIAVGAVGERPARVPGVERSVVGARPGELAEAEIAPGPPEVRPTGDLHGSRDYKLALAATLCRRALERACA